MLSVDVRRTQSSSECEFALRYSQVHQSERSSPLFLRVVGLLPVLILLLWARPSSSNSKARVVSLYISVYDAQGKPVESLNSSDIELLEDKNPQSVSSFHFEKGTPISLGVLLDISKNMAAKGSASR